MAAKRLLPALMAGILLAGCQAAPSQPPIAAEPERTSRMHIHLGQTSDRKGDITHIVQSISLVKAIKHVYPDATLLPDPGINMRQMIDLWVENATKAQYLDQVGRAAGLAIRHDDNTVVLSRVDRWNFTLPSQHVEDVRSLLAGKAGAGVTVLRNDADTATLLVTASPSDLPGLKTAVFQLSDQAKLNDTFTMTAPSRTGTQED